MITVPGTVPFEMCIAQTTEQPSLEVPEYAKLIEDSINKAGEQ